jgi:hypothetical protein
MPADPIHPNQLHGEARFRADLVAYLDSLPVGELAALLGGLPRSRQQPLQLGVLMVALNERLPDAYKLLPPAGQPGPGEGRRRSLRELVADRRAARAGRHPDAPASGMAEWLAERQWQADLHPERAGAGAVGERRVAEALRTRATDPDPAVGRQEPDAPPAERERDRQDQERDRESEDESGDSWGPTGSAPTTSARPTAGRCPSRRRAPSLGCRSASTTRSPTSRRTGRAAGRVRSATTTVRTADPGRSHPPGKPRPGAGACCCSGE